MFEVLVGDLSCIFRVTKLPIFPVVISYGATVFKLVYNFDRRSIPCLRMDIWLEMDVFLFTYGSLRK